MTLVYCYSKNALCPRSFSSPETLFQMQTVDPMPDLLTRWFICVFKFEKHSCSLLDYLLKYSNENYGNPSTVGLKNAEYSHIIYLALYIIFVFNFLLLLYLVLFFSANALHYQFLLSFWPRIRSRYFSHQLLLIRSASPNAIIDILHLHMKIYTCLYNIISCQLKAIFLLCWDNVEVSFHQMSHYLSPPACILFFWRHGQARLSSVNTLIKRVNKIHQKVECSNLPIVTKKNPTFL